MPSRKRGARGMGNTARGRGSRRGRGRAQSAVGDPKTAPYQELLAEVDTAVEEHGQERPLKRRKRLQDRAIADSVGDASKVDSIQNVPHNSSPAASVASPESSTAATGDMNNAGPESEEEHEISPMLTHMHTSPSTLDVQVVYDDTDSSEESDADFERLLLEGIQGDADNSKKPEDEDTVHATVASAAPRPAARVTPRKHAKAKDKIMRVDVHKVSVLCWLMHGYFRSSWCNIQAARNSIRQVMTARQRSFLNPDPTLAQNERSLLFQRGLDEACKSFQENFTITRSDASSREEFIEAAGRFRGSRHTGNHLFCALLRDAGVRARLVCSLQVTKLTSIIPINDVQPTSQNVYSSDIVAAADSDTASDGSTGVSIRPIKRRLGHRSSAREEDKRISARPVPYQRATETTFASPYPIYWVEAFSVANQRWLCVDPLVTKSWNKPRKLEPPLYDEENTMTYVMAYDANLCIKDVTRRYAKAYNAKTYKRRVDSTPGGTQWLRRVLRLFRPVIPDYSDQIEDVELARYEAAEPIPNAQQDFKDHPVYALERHLHHNEVVHPRREVGKVLIGKKQEPIYRRSDVHIVRSSDKWYRSLGRQLRIGEQPLKYGKPRRRRARSVESDGDKDEDGVGAGLYAEFQTQLYVPPPIVDGKIQKNIYRNLDVYVPSMIPAGGAHVRSSDAVQAARLAGIDYAEAVTGFQFKGRKGTAITRGVIVAREYSEAVEAICHGLRAAREDAAAAKQSAEALRMWKKLLLGLRIRERIMAGADPNEGADTLQQRVNDAQDEEEEMEGEGGFFLERKPASEPVAGPRVPIEPQSEIDEIIEAMNRDTGLSRSRAGPTVRREYFEPTIFSPWDVPEREAKVDELPKPEKEPPPLMTEMTNDSLFNDPPGEGSSGDSNDGANELANDSNIKRQELTTDSLHGPGSAEAEDDGGFIRDDIMDTDGGFIVSSSVQKPSALDNDDHDITVPSKKPTQTREEPSDKSGPGTDSHAAALPKIQHTDKDSIADDMDSDMLSHDPEEDDMEEGWLVEETGL